MESVQININVLLLNDYTNQTAPQDTYVINNIKFEICRNDQERHDICYKYKQD